MQYRRQIIHFFVYVVHSLAVFCWCASLFFHIMIIMPLTRLQSVAVRPPTANPAFSVTVLSLPVCLAPPSAIRPGFDRLTTVTERTTVYFTDQVRKLTFFTRTRFIHTMPLISAYSPSDCLTSLQIQSIDLQQRAIEQINAATVRPKLRRIALNISLVTFIIILYTLNCRTDCSRCARYAGRTTSTAFP